MTKRLCLLGAALLLAAGAGSAAAPSKVGKTEKTLQRLVTAAELEDCKTVLRVGEPLLRAGTTALPAKIEAYVIGQVASCAYSNGEVTKALSYLQRGSRREDSDDLLWGLRLGFEVHAQRYDEAVATVEEMSQGRGAALNSVPIKLFYELNNALEEGSQPALRRRLLSVVGGGGYAPTGWAGDAQGLQYQYAELLADEGDLDRARAIMGTLYDPGLLVDAMFDPRLRALLPPDLDLRAAAERALANDRELMARHPDLLAPMSNVVTDLHRLGRAEEALMLLQAVEKQVEDENGFSDREEMLPWYWDSVGRSYVLLGRYEDAVGAFRRGGTLAEGGALNVSQIINLAVVQLRFGQPAEALKTLAVFEDPARKLSGYGHMAMRNVRGCAHAALGNKSGAEADLAYAVAHEKDSVGTLMSLYLCMGRIDEAAAVLIRRLDDPERRSGALQRLAEYEAPRIKIPLDPAEARMPDLKARDDVQAAIARAGGIPRIPLYDIGI